MLHNVLFKYYNNVNNLVIGKIKDETWGEPIKDFLGLILKDNHESNKAKCIYKNNVHDELKYQDYKNIYFKISYMRHEMNSSKQRS